MSHTHPRTERDLNWLAANFSAGHITRGIAERLECLAAWHRTVLEAEKAGSGMPSDYGRASAVYRACVERLRESGVGPAVGEYTFSPCCGPDL